MINAKCYPYAYYFYYVVISLLCNFCLFVPHIIIFQMISSILNCVYRYLINFDSFIYLFISLISLILIDCINFINFINFNYWRASVYIFSLIPTVYGALNKSQS